MMTKIKSGIAAQLKALVVIPTAIFMFFFFAEITFAQNANGFQNKDLTKEIQGFWKNVDDDTYGKLLNFKDDNVQILENFETYREIQIKFPIGVATGTAEHYKMDIYKYAKDKNEVFFFVTLPMKPGKSKLIHLILKEDRLTVGWPPERVSIYQRINAASSLECFSKSINEDFEPVTTYYYRILENPDKTFFLFMNKNGQMFLDGEQIESTKLIEKIEEVKRKGNPFSADEKVPIIVVDARCEMAYVGVMYRKLQEMGELRHILSVKPFDENVPEVFYHNVGIPRLLPPKDAQLMEEEEMENRGVRILELDASKKDFIAEEAARILEAGINDKKPNYVMLLKYNNETSYKEYLTILDKIYMTIYSKRNKLAQEKYNLDFDEIAKVQQKDIRKIYPMALTEKNVDQPEY